VLAGVLLGPAIDIGRPALERALSHRLLAAVLISINHNLAVATEISHNAYAWL
jgi:hypothetical protein